MPDEQQLPIEEEQDMKLDGRQWWLVQAFNFGVPTAILAVLVYGLWRGSSYTMEKVLVPVTNEHITFLKSTAESMKSIDKVVGKIDGTLDQHRSYFDLLKKQADTTQETILLQQKVDAEKDRLALEQHQRILDTLKSIDAKTVMP